VFLVSYRKGAELIGFSGRRAVLTGSLEKKAVLVGFSKKMGCVGWFLR
jgi:hypothetical protein